ncbi:ferric reductase-like transmembrane domain-containing protein [Halomonas vilamensis]|uniref:Protein-methionine-sulfoxide reductase heme-binding subunit MsrQ n=1 Tax=Vreelandella vilamensis TaxID=531309 RepID=A0ABU1H3G6_9GAMM|nr:ferric reductase-like transmembrane domain-containing protein [Halomonas vilamensis]MDR5898764.1 ferric reductase-like transmembrane domain-containing protein [Halomonas vilamensis]
MIDTKAKILLFRFLVLLSGVVPALWLGWMWLSDSMGANPAETAVHFTGRTGLILLLVTIAFSPAFRLSGWVGIMIARRQMGLWAFFWLTAHMLTWMGWDQYWEWRWIWHDMWELEYIRYGLSGLLLLIPLALTSFRWAPEKMGWSAWHWLHRLIYVAAGLGVYHLWVLTRVDYLLPTAFAIVFLALVVFRVVDAILHRQ